MTDKGRDYEEGFIDGMQHQMKSSVDKAVNAKAQRTWVGLTDEELPPLVGDNGKYMELQQVRRFYKHIEVKLKEKNAQAQ